MSEHVKIHHEFLPEDLPKESQINEAYLVKLGKVKVKSKKIFRIYHSDDQMEILKECLSEIYTIFSDSPYVLELFPTYDAIIEKNERMPLMNFIKEEWQWQLNLMSFIKMHVKIPSSEQKTFQFVPWASNNEEFYIYFNGNLFLVYTSIKYVPDISNIGQLARDFIHNTFKNSTLFESDFSPPTPIHPNIFLVEYSHHDKYQTSIAKPNVEPFIDNLCIYVPKNIDIDIINYLLIDTLFSLEKFYTQKEYYGIMENKLGRIYNLNNNLNELMFDYFNSPVFKRFFSSIPKKIRKTIAYMHSAKQDLSNSEIECRNRKDEALYCLNESYFLKNFENYFINEMSHEQIFDYEHQLSLMNFASEETSNFALVQSTLIAALVGSIIGGSISLFSQIWSS